MSSVAENGDAGVLRWAERLLSADDLRRHLNGHRELVLLPRTIITPLAADELRSRGVRILREESPSKSTKQGDSAKLGYALENPDPTVDSAIKTLARDGIHFQPLASRERQRPEAWSRALAECIAQGNCQAGAVFCTDPALVCCIANKLPGLRAAAVLTVPQAARALLSLGANLLAIEMPGRTLFEVRQILKNLCTASLACPPAVARTLQELEAHAHR